MVNNSDDEKRVYFGASDTTFKDRYRNHTRDFNHERYSKCTELPKYIWQLKRNKKKIPSTEWQIVRKVFSEAKSNYCLLCSKVKYFIINYLHEEILLKKRSELISKCRHEIKNMLLETVVREIIIVWINIVYYLLIFSVFFSFF